MSGNWVCFIPRRRDWSTLCSAFKDTFGGDLIDLKRSDDGPEFYVFAKCLNYTLHIPRLLGKSVVEHALPNSHKPQYMTDEEVDAFLPSGVNTPPPEFSIGDVVTVADGYLANMTGIVVGAGDGDLYRVAFALYTTKIVEALPSSSLIMHGNMDAGPTVLDVSPDRVHVGGGQSVPCFNTEQVKSFRPTFMFLNDKDRDILYLFFVSGKKQKDVERVLKRGQPLLCYDIKRIRFRLRFIFYLFSMFDVFMSFVKDHPKEFTDEDIAVLTMMFYCTSFTYAARTIGMRQMRARYVFHRCLRKMIDAELWKEYELFNAICHNLNTVRRFYYGVG